MVKLYFLILISLFYIFTITQCAPVNPQYPNIIANVNKRTSPISSFVPLLITQAKRTSPDTIPISKKSFMPTEIPVIRKRTLPIADEGINGLGGLGGFGGLGLLPLAGGLGGLGGLGGFGGLGLLPLAGGFGAVPLAGGFGGFGAI